MAASEKEEESVVPGDGQAFHVDEQGQPEPCHCPQKNQRHRGPHCRSVHFHPGGCGRKTSRTDAAGVSRGRAPLV
eukprot:11164280-Lingulodinium_polyedra.AAC.1